MRSFLLLPLLAVVGCTAAQTDQFNKAVAQGQQFCAVATQTGPLTVALADTAGVPVTVTGKASDVVAKTCALVGGIPVVPPPAPATAPVVAVPAAVASR